MRKLILIISIFFIFHRMAYGQINRRVESMEFSDPVNYSYLYQVPYVSTSYGSQDDVTKKMNAVIHRTLVSDYLIPPQDDFSLDNGALDSKRWYKQIYDYTLKNDTLSINYEFTIHEQLVNDTLHFDIKNGSLINECDELRAWK